MRKILLSAAGFDPSSGAGVGLDLRVFTEFGFEGMAVLTSLTAQNSSGVRKVRPISQAFLWEQYSALSADVTFSGIKVGMIGTAKNAEVIARILTKSGETPRVVDPVMRSSSGAWLLEKKRVGFYLRAIQEKASVLTPNLDEASLISGIKIKNPDQMKEAAKKIYDTIGFPCLIKGGHLPRKAVDVLFDGRHISLYEHEKIRRDVHGTGCLFSSGLLCFLAQGMNLGVGCNLAGEFTLEEMKRAVKIGRGRAFFSFV